jgi:hypothetical protein
MQLGRLHELTPNVYSTLSRALNPLASAHFPAQGSRSGRQHTNVPQSPLDLYTTHVDGIAYMSTRRRHGLPTARQRR